MKCMQKLPVKFWQRIYTLVSVKILIIYSKNYIYYYIYMSYNSILSSIVVLAIT